MLWPYRALLYSNAVSNVQGAQNNEINLYLFNASPSTFPPLKMFYIYS